MTAERIHTHVLAGDAGVKVAAAIKNDLLNALNNNDQIRIDTEGLAAADVTTVQTLLAARLSAGARGKQVLMAAPLSPVLLTVLDSAGFLAPNQDHRDFWSLARPSSGETAK